MTSQGVPRHALPFDKRHLEAAAAFVLGPVLGATGYARRDTGQAGQVHDFDLALPDGTVQAVEVTMAAEQLEIGALAATQRQGGELANAAGDWSLVIQLAPGARLADLAKTLPAVLAQLASAGVTSFDTRDPAAAAIAAPLSSHGVSRVQGSAMNPGEGCVLLAGAAVGHAGVDSITDACERAASRPDNQAKLASAGGGDLFVWIDASDAGHLAFWDPTGADAARPPGMPTEIQHVWAGQLFTGVDPLGRSTIWCGGLWRAGNGAYWEDLTAVAPHLGLSLE